MRNVPLLVGKNVVQAQQAASARGFVLTIVRRPSGAPPGTVVQQAPQSGADLQRGAQMMVVVSGGRQEVTVPKLVGSTFQAAQQLLTAQGLQAVKKSVASTKAKGVVVAQNPTEATKLPKGSTVTLTVSSGAGRVKAPSVKGMSQGDAVIAVPIVIQIPSQQPLGLVLAQDPPAGQQRPAHSEVRVNVSGGPASTQTLTVTTTRTTTTARTTTARSTTTVGTTGP